MYVEVAVTTRELDAKNFQEEMKGRWKVMRLVMEVDR